MLLVNSEYLFLMPGYVPADLIRLGNKDDGGYVIRKSDVENSSFLISGGINRDWSFELDLMQRNRNIKAYLYDPFTPLVSFKRFLPNIIKSFMHPNKANLSGYVKKFIKIPLDFVKLFQYQKWLTKTHTRHYNVKIGDIVSTKETNLISIIQLIGAKEKFSGILKLDIEGDEYDVLKHFLFQDGGLTYFRTCIIEFHNIISRRNDLKELVSLFKGKNFVLTHTHMNNYANFNEKYNMYDCVELTFSYLNEDEKIQLSELKEFVLPTKLDFPCNKHKSDMKLMFSTVNT